MTIEITDLEVADYEHAEQAQVDWTILDLKPVTDAARSAAYALARDYEGVVEREDMEQELLIAFALRPRMVREVIAEANNPAGVLNFRGYRILRDLFKTKATHHRKQVSFEANAEALGGAA
ncbi:hypothetical protein SEA_AMETHYST_44 [Streptomyces phage Amethyst]|uniref:Uncharacterized protein n=1 Tax=Streptomyces phage Amethyst TaxID=2041205 RepID=A0A291LH02_9CAUD|nr:hypothetical protein KGG83_gp44 [Streptomyces phage Amethyst]ATI18666.1 hypothetical protein SEA_AMETHYST_44 [Streptomyces phage Amethyst]